MCQSANDSKESGSSLLNFHENLSCFAGAECFSVCYHTCCFLKICFPLWISDPYNVGILSVLVAAAEYNTLINLRLG